MSDPERNILDRTIGVIRAGGVIGLPTETVYGLAADATQSAAVRKILN